MTKKIPLNMGRKYACKGMPKGYVTVDDDDYEWLSKISWHLHPKGYAIRSKLKGEEPHTIFMHRMILNTPRGMDTDHINHDKLDNRRCNLRVVTRRQNSSNRIPNIKKDNQLKGVTWHRASGKWQARIKFEQKKYYLGVFKTEKEAAIAYNLMAAQLDHKYILPNSIVLA